MSDCDSDPFMTGLLINSRLRFRVFVVIMPPSALDQLTRLNVDYPMLFKLTNAKKNRVSHAGVLEFVADEGKVYIPYWVRLFTVQIARDNTHPSCDPR